MKASAKGKKRIVLFLKIITMLYGKPCILFYKVKIFLISCCVGKIHYAPYRAAVCIMPFGISIALVSYGAIDQQFRKQTLHGFLPCIFFPLVTVIRLYVL